jgi:hypothetical protein
MNVHSHEAPQMWPQSGADGGRKLSSVPLNRRGFCLSLISQALAKKQVPLFRKRPF